MTYNKPSIEVLGEAVRAIQGSKPSSLQVDSQTQVQNQTFIAPAYELDE